MRLLIRFVCAVLATYVVAVVFVSLFNAQSIVRLGFPVSLMDRVNTILHDQVGMLSLYLPVLAVGLLIAFLFTGLLLLRFFQGSRFLYPLAGFVAVLAIHLTLEAVFDVNAVAPTATTLGLLSQCLAGALGGWVFYRLGTAG